MTALSRRALLTVLALACRSASAGAPEPVNPYTERAKAHAKQLAFELEHYEQTVSIIFKTAEARNAAQVRILPVFEGKDWAFSARWDDNRLPVKHMAALMKKHGIKGTFYLNGWYKPFWAEKPSVKGPDGKVTRGRRYEARSFDDRILLDGGHSIGAHNYTHPRLSHLNRNRIFYEVMRVRAEREASSDSPVMSHAAAFCNIGNRLQGYTSTVDCTEALLRAGYLHFCRNRLNAVMPMPTSNLPRCHDKLDHELARKEFAKTMANEELRAKQPNVSIAMHVTVQDDHPKYWAFYDEHFAGFRAKANLWYCNQGEYGSYRVQVLTTRLHVSGAGRTMTIALERPAVRDLGHPVPITLEIAGVASDQVDRVASDKSTPTRVAGRGAYTFNLPHPKSQKVFTVAGLVPNLGNRATPAETDVDEDLPGVRGLAWVKDGKLHASVKNKGNAPLTNVRLRFRLPLAYKERVVDVRQDSLAVGASLDEAIELVIARSDYRLLMDEALFSVQVDFEKAGQAARLHLYTVVPSEVERDPSYPAYGFMRAGPIPIKRFDPVVVLEACKTGSPIQVGEMTYTWVPDDPRTPLKLSAEMANIMPPGSSSYAQRPYRFWGEKQGRYVLRSMVVSDVDQKAVLYRNHTSTVKCLFVNGEPVRTARAWGEPSAEFDLNKGENALVLICECRKADTAGVFLRLAKPGPDTSRLTNIQYVAR